FTAFMKTQMAVVKSKPVLQAALRQPQVAELSEIREHADALAWLEKWLEVDTTLGVEILRITLSGDRPDDIAAILNAICAGYLQQMEQAEQAKSVARIEQLQTNFRQYQENLRKKRAALKELEDQLGVDGT